MLVAILASFLATKLPFLKGNSDLIRALTVKTISTEAPVSHRKRVI